MELDSFYLTPNEIVYYSQLYSLKEKDISKPKNKIIPRPPNEFILFSMKIRKTDKLKKLKKFPKLIAIELGNLWRNLPQEEKNFWKIKAYHVKIKHLKDNPGYKFKSTKKKSFVCNKK